MIALSAMVCRNETPEHAVAHLQVPLFAAIVVEWEKAFATAPKATLVKWT